MYILYICIVPLIYVHIIYIYVHIIYMYILYILWMYIIVQVRLNVHARGNPIGMIEFSYLDSPREVRTCSLCIIYISPRGAYLLSLYNIYIYIYTYIYIMCNMYTYM
jgi:hypothetical protein